MCFCSLTDTASETIFKKKNNLLTVSSNVSLWWHENKGQGAQKPISPFGMHKRRFNPLFFESYHVSYILLKTDKKGEDYCWCYNGSRNSKAGKEKKQRALSHYIATFTNTI